jgi:hypothetical protein
LPNSNKKNKKRINTWVQKPPFYCRKRCAEFYNRKTGLKTQLSVTGKLGFKITSLKQKKSEYLIKPHYYNKNTLVIP